jgi:hypothetical protein
MEQAGVVFNALDLYSAGARFESRPQNLLS